MPQEIERLRFNVQYPRLLGIESQTEPVKNLLGLFQIKLWTLSAQNDESSRPGELHPQALTDSGLERLRSSGSYRPVAARRNNGQ